MSAVRKLEPLLLPAPKPKTPTPLREARTPASDPFRPRELLVPPVARAAYSDRTAWLMAKCSQLAYEKFETDPRSFIEKATLGGFRTKALFNSKETQAFLAEREDLAVLAFRGTEQNQSDILTDLKVRFYRAHKTEVHGGFFEAYLAVARDIEQAVRTVRNKPIYITGHSLGGALATIAGWNLDSDRLAAIYTFGSPRVGKSELDGIIKTPVYRIVNSSDIVARIPLMSMGYQHVGDLKYLTKRGKMIRSPSDVRMLYRFVKNFLVNWRSCYLDHSIEEYCRKLSDYAMKRNP